MVNLSRVSRSPSRGRPWEPITDIDGKYTLKVHEGAELVFSFVGMQTQTVRFKGEPSLNIILRDDNVALDDSWSSATAVRTARA